MEGGLEKKQNKPKFNSEEWGDQPLEQSDHYKYGMERSQPHSRNPELQAHAEKRLVGAYDLHFKISSRMESINEKLAQLAERENREKDVEVTAEVQQLESVHGRALRELLSNIGWAGILGSPVIGIVDTVASRSPQPELSVGLTFAGIGAACLILRKAIDMVNKRSNPNKDAQTV